ncbi:MAG: phospho-N-acetylmuramoyl-pentapeptide-transferase, partial [Alphaproteobacteria bacterium]|nr:phospho-N-acetylmuramoyl-pentapeptide-transferase [Alphaproteobacteria bacterium]
DIPESHMLKKGTPTMGGFMMLLAIVVSTLLWADIANGYVWVALLVTLGFGAVGFVDDFLKVSKRNPKGLSGRMKMAALIAIAAVAALWFAYLTRAPLGTSLAMPVFKNALIPLGYTFFIPFAVFVMVGASNAVNLTDGLDGLAIGPVMIAAGCFSLIAYLVGNAVFANYLQINHVPGVGELAVFCSALVGAGLGFLWYNAHPAQVFMGDTGSLAIGGALGAVAVATKHELVLAVIGGLFVVEALSVMIQVFWFKRTGRRIFLMAPIHHHFQKKGWHEQQIVVRFWIIAVILALAGLSTLKLR